MSHVVPLEKCTNSTDISEPCELINDVFYNSVFIMKIGLSGVQYKGLFTWRWETPGR